MSVDRQHKQVRRYHVSDAALHDSQAVDHLLMQGNTGAGVRADPACRSEEMETRPRGMKMKSHIHRKGKRGKPLTEQGKGGIRTKPPVRARDEHIFGAQANDMGGTLVRTIGMVRAKAGGVSKPCWFVLCSDASVRYAEAAAAAGDPPCPASIRPNSAACLPA